MQHGKRPASRPWPFSTVAAFYGLAFAGVFDDGMLGRQALEILIEFRRLGLGVADGFKRQ